MKAITGALVALFTLVILMPATGLGHTETRGDSDPGGISSGLERSRPIVAPLIATRWGGGCFYNASCPADTAAHGTCLHVPAGSGAIAMAQIMKYYGYPAHGTGEHGYVHPVYGIQYANFSATAYTWSEMPDSLVTPHDGLATLMFQCAVGQNMNFGTLASASAPDDLDSALVKYFGYPSGPAWKSRAAFTPAEWIQMLKTELDAQRPVIYTATDSSGLVRHYFICDGYDAADRFHFISGLGSAMDGYCSPDSLALDGINFSSGQQALTGLAPPMPAGYVMDFEDVPDFSLTFGDWTVNDADKHDTYGITDHTFPHQMEPMAYISFNPAVVTPSMSSDPAIQPHGGQRFGACFSSNPPSNSDWFISPKILLGQNGSFTFWIKSYTDFYGLDEYTVAVSTTDNAPGSFTVISGQQPLQSSLNWTRKTFSLAGFNGQYVYVAIHCVSNDHFLMMIDDLEVRPQASTLLTADFTADITTVRIGETVNFTDLSSGNPLSWEWKFPGGSPASSTLQNPPPIRYSVAGVYNVSLKVSTGSAADSVTKYGFINATGYATTALLDFESYGDFVTTFSPWTVVDVRGGNTYGIKGVYFPNNYQPMACICFNPSKTTPPLTYMQPHSGQKLGCCFSSTPPMNPNDKWLISPKMSLGASPKIEFWVKTYNNQFGDERYNVMVSTTDLNPSSFVSLTSLPEAAPSEWTLRSYDLSGYTNRDVYVGIQCITNDGFIFMIDDIAITSTLGTGETGISSQWHVFPNPASDFLFLDPPRDETSSVDLELITLPGQQVLGRRVSPAGGRVLLGIREVPAGAYLLRLKAGKKEKYHKVLIVR